MPHCDARQIPQTAVARMLAMSRAAVNGWVRHAETEGDAALKGPQAAAVARKRARNKDDARGRYAA